MTAAYLDNPNDLQTVYHLGFTHFWAFAERQNLKKIPSSHLNHPILAQKYLGEAYRLNPNDARILSFLSAAKMIVGTVSGDEELITDGYLNGLKAIREWEDFGEFSLAYSLSRLPYSDPGFQKSLALMKSTLERCYCENFENKAEDCIRAISQLVEEPKQLGKRRVVVNSWVAPHNIEGFFMSYGDLLVKHGDWVKGKEMYEFAKYSPDYENWDYKEILEKRIQNARQNEVFFRMEIPKGKQVAIDETILVQSPIACMACHKMSKKDLETKYQKFIPKKYMTPEFYLLQK